MVCLCVHFFCPLESSLGALIIVWNIAVSRVTWLAYSRMCAVGRGGASAGWGIIIMPIIQTDRPGGRGSGTHTASCCLSVSVCTWCLFFVLFFCVTARGIDCARVIFSYRAVIRISLVHLVTYVCLHVHLMDGCFLDALRVSDCRIWYHTDPTNVTEHQSMYRCTVDVPL